MVIRRTTPRPRRPTAGRPSAIVNLQASDRPVFRNWLIYADAGVGKTVLAGTVPGRGLMLSYDAEGSESARAFGSKVDEWQIDTWLQHQEAEAYFTEGSGCTDYDWVIPDNISTLEEHLWAHTVGEGYRRNKKRGEFKRAMGDYPEVWDGMKRTVNTFNRLPINVLYTANTMRVDGFDPETEEELSQLMPLVGSPKRGDTAGRICASVSLVGLLRVARKEGRTLGRRLYLEGNDFWVAKTRYPAMGAFINSPNIASMAETAAAGAAVPKPRRKRPAEKENT